MIGSNTLNSWAQQNTYVPVYGDIGYTYESSGLSGYDNNGGVAFKVAVIDDKAYVASLFLGVQVVDLNKVLNAPITNPVITTLDTKIGTGAIDTLPRDIKAIKDSKVITITNEALIGIDPASDSIMWTLDLSSYGSFFRMEIAEDVYYTDAAGVQQTMDIAFVTTSYNKKLLIIDITNIPQIIKEINFAEPVFKVHYNKEHKLLFIQVGSNLLVYELNSMLSNNLQGNPRQVGMYEGGGWANDIISDGNYLYIGEWGNFKVVQYDPDWGMELADKDEEFPTVKLSVSDYYPALGEKGKEIWIKVKDKYNVNYQPENKQANEEYLASFSGIKVRINETKIEQGGSQSAGTESCKADIDEADIASGMAGTDDKGKFSKMNDKGQARFRIICASLRDGKINVIFEREAKNTIESLVKIVYKKLFQAYTIFNIKSNANVKFSEVENGSAVYTYDTDEAAKSTTAVDKIGSSEDKDKKFDFVQEAFNQVIPRKRNLENPFTTPYTYNLMDENGKYNENVYNGLVMFKKNFKLAVNDKVGPYNPDAPVGSRYSSDKNIDDTSLTFRKLMKDYGKRQVGDSWLIDGAPSDSWKHKVIDKDTLSGENGYQPGDVEITTNDSVVINTGVYELYANVVRKFVDEMIKEGKRYAGISGTPVPTSNWIARTGEGAGTHGHGMSYCYGCKDSIEDFNNTVANCGAEKTTAIKARETDDAQGNEYRGNIAPNCAVGGGGTLDWAGLYSSKGNNDEYNLYLKCIINKNSTCTDKEKLEAQAFNPAYWAGIDCSGFVYWTMRSGKGLLGDSVAMADVSAFRFTDNRAAGYFNEDRAMENSRVFSFNTRNAEKLRKGDLIRYRGRQVNHVSTVYSDRPSSCSTDKDGKTTCTYEIIHAYGGDSYRKKVGAKREKTFSRKVLVTPNDISKTISNPTGFGRIKLWD